VARSELCRAVAPWTWARQLRDHGPRDRDFLLAMLTLELRMDPDGFAWPGLRLWAADACMAVGTLRKHIATAIRHGWLGIERKRGRKPDAYRAAVPRALALEARDIELADHLVSRVGEIDESVLAMHDTQELRTRPCVQPMSDTQEQSPGFEASVNRLADACVSTDQAVACQVKDRCVSNPPACVSHAAGSEVLEVSERSHKREEGALTRTPSGIVERLRVRKPEPEPATDQEIRRAIAGFPGWSDHEIATRGLAGRASAQQVTALRASMIEKRASA